MKETVIIAEAGVNHNGSLDLALQLVDAAVIAGADIVKFQTFDPESLASKQAGKADYQKQATPASSEQENENQRTMLRRLVLSQDAHWEIKDYCQRREIGFLSTPFDLISLNFLVNELQMPLLKISSGEVTNAPLLLAFARTGCDLILSTGMSSLAEVDQALEVLAWGIAHPGDSTPSRTDLQLARTSPESREELSRRVILLHCTSQYPAPIADINLRAIANLRQCFGMAVGYSDHTEGITVATAAVALGATIIEKHFTLSRDMDGPDHKASLEPDELKAMVTAVREVELSLGDGVKISQESERNTREVARKSLIAAQPIGKGELFSPSNLVAMRPGTGVSPMCYWDYLGQPAAKAYVEGDLIEHQ